MMTNIYKGIYDLLVNGIFGGSLEGVTYGQFFVEGFSIIACALLLLLPFIIVWRIIRRFL